MGEWIQGWGEGWNQGPPLSSVIGRLGISLEHDMHQYMELPLNAMWFLDACDGVCQG